MTVAGIIETGVERDDNGMLEAFKYEYETAKSDVGIYTLDDATVIGGAAPMEERHTDASNYMLTQNIKLEILGDQPTPTPTPEPILPEFVNVQTGDILAGLGFPVFAMFTIAMLALFVSRKNRKFNYRKH